MVFIFLVFIVAMIAILLKKRLIAMSFIGLGLILILLVFWHHITNVLDINL